MEVGLLWATVGLAIVTGLLAIATIALAVIAWRQLNAAKDATNVAREQAAVLSRQADVLTLQAEAAKASAEAERDAVEEMRAARAREHPLALDLNVQGAPGQARLLVTGAGGTMLIDYVVVRQVQPPLPEPLFDHVVVLTVGTSESVLVAQFTYDYATFRELVLEISGRPLDGIRQRREWVLQRNEGAGPGLADSGRMVPLISWGSGVAWGSPSNQR